MRKLRNETPISRMLHYKKPEHLLLQQLLGHALNMGRSLLSTKGGGEMGCSHLCHKYLYSTQSTVKLYQLVRA